MSNIKKYFFTSDSHFSHRNIIKYCNRPFIDVEEMNNTMVNNWNSVVSDNDIVYHLGDVAFEKDRRKLEDLLSRLNGEKHLIWGNHDNLIKSIAWKDYFKTTADLKNVNVPPESNGGVGQRIVLCHYAMRVWDQSHYGTIHLHGHSHGSLPDDPHMRSMDVGVDCHNFTPVSMEQINAHMAKKIWKPVDHHNERQ